MMIEEEAVGRTVERNEGCFVLITALPVIQSDFTRKGSVDDDEKGSWTNISF